jgi:hypothetical protein
MAKSLGCQFFPIEVLLRSVHIDAMERHGDDQEADGEDGTLL